MLAAFSAAFSLFPSALSDLIAQDTNVEFFVVDGWGNPVSGDIKITVSPVGGQKPAAVVEYPSVRRTRLAKGDYSVLVDARGFQRTPQTITVGAEPLFAPLTLVLAPIEGHGAPTTKVSGTLGGKYTGGAAPLWIRLVGLYTGANRVAEVDEHGAFAFEGIPPGRYMIFVFSQGNLKEQQLIDVSALSNVLNLE